MLHGFRWGLLVVMSAVLVMFTSPASLQADGLDQPADNVPTFTEGLVGEVVRLNPLLAQPNPAEAAITSLIFEGLTQINEYGEAMPLLAADWVVSFDGLEYVVTLRNDVIWQDGTPFTADDVVYTMSLLSDPAFPGPAQLSAFWRTVETERIDTHLVRFRLTQPLASFPDALRIGILPVHALRGTTAAQLPSHLFNLTPIGTGPYQIEAIRQGANGSIQQIDLRVAPNYRNRPGVDAPLNIDRMRFVLFNTFDDAQTALGTGQIDGYAARTNTQRMALLRLGAEVAVYTGYEPAIGFLMFNWANEDFQVFREERVRRALYMGMDQTRLIAQTMPNSAVPANSPLLPLSWAYAGNLPNPTFDVAAATAELSIANIRVPDGAESAEIVFSFNILVPENTPQVALAQGLADQWSGLTIRRGEVDQRINVTVEAVPAQSFIQRVNDGTYQAAIVELSKAPSADPDVYAFWHQGQYPDGQNISGANDRQISEALERARQDESGVNRAIHYRQFQELFVERAIAIPLYYPLFTYAVNSAVEGIQLGFLGSAVDRFQTIGNWSINAN